MTKKVFTIIHHLESYYACIVSGISESGDIAKFDTGAAHTMITPNILYNRVLSAEEMCNLKSNLEERHSDVSLELESASGHKTKCYLFRLRNIIISGVELKEFYFFLAPQENSKFLIGDDFISKTTFRHEINSDIIISEFDHDGYVKYFKSYIDILKEKNKRKTVKVIEADDISDILSFSVNAYLSDYMYILPKASVEECKTKEDCDSLLERLGLK